MDLSLSISVYDLLSICTFHITSADISEYNYHFRELNCARRSYVISGRLSRSYLQYDEECAKDDHDGRAIFALVGINSYNARKAPCPI